MGDGDAPPRHLHPIRVLLKGKGLRPEFLSDAPADIADIVRACWTTVPEARPTLAEVLQGMEANG